jgi:hypothetical protein
MKKTLRKIALIAVIAAGFALTACPNTDSSGETQPKTYTVTFDSNGGNIVTDQIVKEGDKVKEPQGVLKEWHGLDGWYMADGNKWNFDTDTVTSNITLYARWMFNTFANIDDMGEYLAAQTDRGGVGQPPAFLPVNIDFGTATGADDDWQSLLALIDETGKFVDLDLSACDMDDTVFDPIYSIDTGKDKIISLVLPDNATEIKSGLPFGNRYTFAHFSNLKTVTASNVNIIGSYTFSNCTELTDVNFPSATVISSAAFSGCTGLIKKSFPATATVTGAVFSGCTSLTTFNLIGDGLLSTIESGKILVYDNTKLVAYPSASGNITINNVTSIAGETFSSNVDFTVANFPSVTEIDSKAFYNCQGLIEVNFPVATEIGNNAFYMCRDLNKVSFPLAKNIGELAFIWCALAEANFPEAIIINRQAFQECKSLTKAFFPKATSIGIQAFVGCTNLTDTNFPEVTVIGSNAFGTGSVYSCTSLIEINFPKVTEIGSEAFYGCTSLALVTFDATTPPTLDAGTYSLYWTFENTSSSLQIKVPAGSVDAYKSAEGWSTYESKIFSQ